MLSKHYCVPMYTASDLIRSSTSDIKVDGLSLKEYIARGRLLPDAVVSSVVLHSIPPSPSPSSKKSALLLDGFPRTVGQAVSAAPFVRYALHVDVPPWICSLKIRGRRSCADCKRPVNVGAAKGEGFDLPALMGRGEAGGCSEEKCGKNWTLRRDDTDAAIVDKRLADYHDITAKVLDYYRSQGRLVTFKPFYGIDDFGKLVAMIDEAERSFDAKGVF